MRENNSIEIAEGGENWNDQNTTLHRRREYRPPTALANAAKNDCHKGGRKECFKTGCKITDMDYFHIWFSLNQNMSTADLISQLMTFLRSGVKPDIPAQWLPLLSRCCGRHHVAKLNLLTLKSRWNNKSRINTGRLNRFRPNKSPGNWRMPLAKRPRMPDVRRKPCPV